MEPQEFFEASVTAGVREATWIDSRRALFPGGRNGPYLDIESPVRNSAHWLATLSIGHHLGIAGARTVGHAVTEFLLSDHPYRTSQGTIQRQRHPKDWCNGVIGDAWIIEALALAGRLLDHEGAASAAIRLSKDQPYASRRAAWRRVDPGGRSARVDRTLNHQLWFAAAASEALRTGGAPVDRTVAQRVLNLLERGAAGAFGIRVDGTIEHNLRVVGPRVIASVRDPRRSARIIRSHIDPRQRLRVAERDAGYHLYVILGFARLRAALPDHPLWISAGLRSAVHRAADPVFHATLHANPYAYPYNAPGFGLPLIARCFGDVAPTLATRSDEAWERQVSTTWDALIGRFGRGTPDGLTLAARIYELGLSFLDDAPIGAMATSTHE